MTFLMQQLFNERRIGVRASDLEPRPRTAVFQLTRPLNRLKGHFGPRLRNRARWFSQ